MTTSTQESNQTGLFCRIKNALKTKRNDDKLRDALDTLINDVNDTGNTEGSAIAAHERALISNIFELRDLSAIEVMVPRAEINAIDIQTSFDDLIAVLEDKPHSRFPVFEGDLDNVIGAAHMKDIVKMFKAQDHFDLRDHIRPVSVVSPSMKVTDLLLQMRQSRQHLAMVVDEFGGIDGLITINDLIEAVVGEIEDEHSFEEHPRLFETSGGVIVDARYELEDFKDRYGSDVFNAEDFEDSDTLGGLVNTLAGHLPTRGEVITHENGIEFEVLDADPRKIKRLRVRNLPDPVA